MTMMTKAEFKKDFYDGKFNFSWAYDCMAEYHQLTRVLEADSDHVFGYFVPYNDTKKEFFKRKLYYTANDRIYFKLNGTTYYMDTFLRNDSYDYKEDRMQ